MDTLITILELVDEVCFDSYPLPQWYRQYVGGRGWFFIPRMVALLFLISCFGILCILLTCFTFWVYVVASLWHYLHFTLVGVGSSRLEGQLYSKGYRNIVVGDTGKFKQKE